MDTGKRGINTVFAVLGSVAAAGLLITGFLWASSDQPLDKNGSQGPRSESSDSQIHSGRGSVPEKQQSGSPTTKPGEKGMGDPIGKADSEDTPTTKHDGASSDGLTKDVNPTFRVYLIQPGDTLSSISASVGVSVDRLAHVNNISDVNCIYAGSALTIPVP